MLENNSPPSLSPLSLLRRRRRQSPSPPSSGLSFTLDLSAFSLALLGFLIHPSLTTTRWWWWYSSLY
ncbi:hypothetical protein Hanom_Chr02g00132701 [Helianthus anomalus]